MIRGDIASTEAAIKHLRGSSQSPARELELYRLDINLRRLQAKRDEAIAAMEDVLLGFYIQNGSARVMVKDMVHEARPHMTGNEVQNVWNVRSEIRRLAALKIHSEG